MTIRELLESHVADHWKAIFCPYKERYIRPDGSFDPGKVMGKSHYGEFGNPTDYNDKPKPFDKSVLDIKIIELVLPDSSENAMGIICDAEDYAKAKWE